MNDEFVDEDLSLLKSIAKSEGLKTNSNNKLIGYVPLFKHPLPPSENKFLHEDILKKVCSCRINNQAIAAVTKGGAWALEEIYIRHGKKCLEPKNGNYPIHLAVQLNSIDCVLVLINIGIDLNVESSLGFTPLFIAKSYGFKQMEKLLAEHGAKLYSDKKFEAPVVTILESKPELNFGKFDSKIEDFLNIPQKKDQF